jgi:thymidylate synthase ThyX
MTKLSNLNPNAERRGGVVVSITDSAPTVTPESIKARKTVIGILKRSGYDQYRTANEQRNAQLKNLSGGGSCEGVISNHCDISPKDVELLENLYRAAWEARKKQIESKEYKEKARFWLERGLK